MTRPATADSAALARLHWLAPAVLALALALTAMLCVWSLRNHAAEADALLERRSEAFAQALSNRVQAYIDTLPGLQAFGVPKASVSDAEFAQYVRSISLQNRFPGLALTFLAEWVPAGDRAAFIERVRADRSLQPAGHPGFDIAPPGDRPGYMVLRHTHPFDAGGFGYDLYDPAQRYRAAVEHTLRSGRYVATGPLLLARDRDKTPRPELSSIVIRGGVYAGGLTPETAEARMEAAQGVVGISFRSLDLVRSVLAPELARDAALRIVDRTAAAAGESSLVFDSSWLDAGGPPQATDDGPRWLQGIDVADRQWEITVRSRAARWRPDGTTWWLLALGLALSASLAVMTHTLVQANIAAERRIRLGTAALQEERDNLERSERRYRMLFANSFDAVLRTRPDGQVLAANAAACRLFGRSEAELQALHRDALVDRSDTRLGPLLEERARTGRAQGLIRMLRADGSAFEAEVASNVYRDGDGRETASVIVRDVTERQRLQAQLQESQKLEALGTLAGGVAHDFNNVLAAILGNVALARQDVTAGRPPQASLDRIEQAGTRARTLVQQILTFSRRNPQPRQVQPLRPAVEEALSLLRSTLPASARLVQQLGTEPLPVQIDAAQVQQVVLNLCTNACQALHEAHGRIDVRLTAVDRPGGRCALLQVQDDGVGMDEATRIRVFEPFFTTKPVGQGTGLGLAVVHGIVVACGGSIEVRSTLGAGTVVEIVLPLAETAGLPDPDLDTPPETDTSAATGHGAAPATPQPADLPAATPAPAATTRAGLPGRGEHLLYVDDDEVVALTVELLLQRQGWRVTRLADAAAALALLHSPGHGVDLLITDHNMPGMSGLALAERLHGELPQLPVIITSGHVTDALQQRATAAGVRALLLKEFAAEQLAALVQATLQARR